MKVLKIIGIVILIIWIVLTTLCTIYFLFAHRGFGLQMIRNDFEDGFIPGIKNFFINIWRGIKFVFGE